MKVAIVVGHRQNAQGAVGDAGVSEFEFNSGLAKDIVRHTNKHELKIFYRRDDLSGYTERMKDLHKRIDAWGATVSISLHFNAASSPSVDGHEVLYYSKTGGKLARALNGNFNLYLDNRDRGVKRVKKNERGGGFLSRGKSYCVLAEPFFAAHQSKYMPGTSGYDALLLAYINFIDNIVI